MANAITQWINSKSDQSNVATNSEILKNSKMIEQDLTQILYAIVPMVEALDETEYDSYYVKMGAAWLLCECFIKFRDVTLNYLGTTKIDIWTFNKGIQKMIESYRVSQSDKILLKELKRVK